MHLLFIHDCDVVTLHHASPELKKFWIYKFLGLSESHALDNYPHLGLGMPCFSKAIHQFLPSPSPSTSATEYLKALQLKKTLKIEPVLELVKEWDVWHIYIYIYTYIYICVCKSIYIYTYTYFLILVNIKQITWNPSFAKVSLWQT